jgi:hypothetical protein
MGGGDEASIALRELDLHFDPYSDGAQAEYEALRTSIRDMDIDLLLGLEQAKSQPDAFVLAQISRALRFQDPATAQQLCATLLDAKNLDSFRASWSRIMRGIYAVRNDDEFSDIHDRIDELIDNLPRQVSHLLTPETNLLHYLRIVRLKRTSARGRFVRQMYDQTNSRMVRRACIDCWRQWGDRGSFQRLRNDWPNLTTDEQRLLWLAADKFGEEGIYAKKQLQRTLAETWRLGIEDGEKETFAAIYRDWADNVL